jgi:hypothetical protein
MLYLAILASIAALSLSVAALPGLIICAGTTWALAYWFSRHRALLRLGGTYALFAFAHSVLASLARTELVAQAGELELALLRFCTADVLLLVVSVIVTLISVVAGIRSHGTRRRPPVLDASGMDHIESSGN